MDSAARHETSRAAGGCLRQLMLARSPDEPPFALALLKLVLELRRQPKGGLEEALQKAVKGLRVDREAFREYVRLHRERYLVAAVGGPPLRRTRAT